MLHMYTDTHIHTTHINAYSQHVWTDRQTDKHTHLKLVSFAVRKAPR